MKAQPAVLFAAAERVAREIETRASGKLRTYFPAAGPLRRELYPKHVAWMAAGARYRERALLAGNRTGKSDMGAFELALHLTGLYPPWWEGRRFPAPISAWAVGDTTGTTRDIVQVKLLGAPGALGTGFIPTHLVLRQTRKRTVADAVESVWVRHVTGGASLVQLKSYDQKREAFQGTAQDVIWLDEEPPSDIYAECLLRTTATAGFGGGILMATFTPLQGLTELVETFLPGGTVAEFSPDAPGAKYVVMASWDDVPHLSADEKAALLAAMPPHQRAARTQGIPYLGAGVIYPVEESDITVQDFALPAHWPRGYGMDVGWQRTAAVWGAYDRSADTLYLYSMHYRGEAEPPIHAEAIKARGALLPGRIDPASRGRSQSDGQQLLQQYRRLGLRLEPAPNAVEAGIYEVWTRLSTGRLKVFASLQSWFEEFRVYRRDDRGRVVKARDHGLDASRYLCASGVATKPAWSWLQTLVPQPKPQPRRTAFVGRRQQHTAASLGWMK